MIVKKTKQLGNFKKGINLYVPTRRRVSAAPSGIVAATAGSLIISFGLFSAETYFKNTDTYWQFDFGEQGSGETQDLTWNYRVANGWALDTNSGFIQATNPSTNQLIIPTTGWTYTVGTGPAITITAG